MTNDPFDRDTMARFYAKRHLKTDAAIRSIYYLPKLAPGREIRLLEINEAIADRDLAPLEPIDFGVDVDSVTGHRLMVLDITPAQGDRVRAEQLPLPGGWTLDEAETISRTA